MTEIYMRVNLVCFITGTAAISVGFRTVASPLLPFLILVDCEEKISTNKQIEHKLLKATTTPGVTEYSHIWYEGCSCLACLQTITCRLLPFLMKVLEHAVHNHLLISYPEQPPGS